MTAASSVLLLAQASGVISLAVLGVLLLRALLARRLGAQATYAIWLGLPLSIAALALWQAWPPAQTGLAWSAPVVVTGIDAVRVPVVDSRPDAAWILLSLWLAGAVAAAVRCGVRQRRFVRALGCLRARGDGSWAAAGQHGPALIGLLHPRIIVPADFERRYDARQRELVLEHERIHRARGDLWVNAAVAALQCLQWFNPLVHLAARRLRDDQELSCDALVIARHPNARRAYADAMLSTQLAVPGLPVGCTWQSSHPLKERISMLKHPSSNRTRRALAVALALGLAAGTGAAVAGFGPAEVVPAAETAASTEVSYRRLAPPTYPAEALRNRQSGDVVLHVRVGRQGEPLAIEIDRSSGHASIDEAAVAAAREWQFNPGRRDGVPVEGWVAVPISFRLDEADAPMDPPQGALDTIWTRASALAD